MEIIWNDDMEDYGRLLLWNVVENDKLGDDMQAGSNMNPFDKYAMYASQGPWTFKCWREPASMCSKLKL